MHIVLLADTHGFIDPRIHDAVRAADLLIHAGDVGADVADWLTTTASEVQIVAGNNDPVDSGWPQTALRQLPGGQLAVIHGHQWPARTRHRKLREYFPEADAVVYGHSHRRVIETQDTPWLLNPGAAGRTRAYGGPSYIELTAKTSGWRIETHVLEPLMARRRRRRA